MITNNLAAEAVFIKTTFRPAGHVRLRINDVGFTCGYGDTAGGTFGVTAQLGAGCLHRHLRGRALDGGCSEHQAVCHCRE